jgi:hypothetical protein
MEPLLDRESGIAFQFFCAGDHAEEIELEAQLEDPVSPRHNDRQDTLNPLRRHIRLGI